MTRQILFQQHFLKFYALIYREATERLKNAPSGLPARDWVKLESVRQHALYKIAVLLELPDLPRPNGLLSREQWQQCIDFIAKQGATPCP